MEIIEVIDTAVKVGLGALISGLTTYAVSARNHKSEKSKEAAKKRVEILTFSLEKLDNYFSCFSSCVSILSGQLLQGVNPGPLSAEFKVYYKKLDERLTLSRADRAIAASRLHLLGLKEANNIIIEVMAIERDLRNEVVFKNRLLSEQELKDIGARLRIEKNKTYDLLAKAFNDVYK